MVENVGMFMITIFGLLLSILTIKYIAYQVCFIIPMKRKYDLLLPIRANTYNKIFTFIGILFLIAYPISLIIFSNIYISLSYKLTIILPIVYISFGIYYTIKYRKCGILEYINNYSSDLLDWNKIYDLKIDEDLKRRCFAIHNMNYDTYKN